MTHSYSEIYKWLNIAHEKNYRTCAFVIMPNHLHFIIATPEDDVHLNKLVSNGKRFIAYEIVERLKQESNNHVLNQLTDAVTPSDKKRGKLHQVFKPSFDARLILNETMLLQKIRYIHHNPVSGKWNLASDFISYPHSSAAFYEIGKPCLFPITHYAEILHGR